MTAARVALGALLAAAICVGLALLVAAGAQSGVTTLTGPPQPGHPAGLVDPGRAGE